MLTVIIFIALLVLGLIKRRGTVYFVHAAVATVYAEVMLSLFMGLGSFDSATPEDGIATSWLRMSGAPPIALGLLAVVILAVTWGGFGAIVRRGYRREQVPLRALMASAWVLGTVVVAIVVGKIVFALPQAPEAGEVATHEWQLVESTEGLFRSMWPGSPAKSSETMPNPTGRPAIVVHSLDLETATASYAIQWMQFDDSHIDPSATVERVLESTRDGMIEATAGELLAGGFIEHEGWPALDATIRVVAASDSVIGQTRVIVVGRTAYTLMVFGGGSAEAARFLEAFEVLGASDSFRLPNRASSN